MKQWVIIKMNSGAIKIWRDYGTAWGSDENKIELKKSLNSPAYQVLGYFQGAHKAARAFVKNLPKPVEEFGTIKGGK